MRFVPRLFLWFSLLVPALGSPASAGEATPAAPLSRELRALGEGRALPPQFRPHTTVPDLTDGIASRRRVAQPAGAAASREYSVMFQYDGPRSTLEAEGIRVVTQAGPYFTARVRPDEVKRLGYVAGIREARLERRVEPQLTASLIDVRADLAQSHTGTPPVFSGHAGKNVLVGCVDSGIDFLNFDFNAISGGTRILYIWDQTDNGGPHPLSFAYGSEWTKAKIDSVPGSIRQQDTDNHGTGVAGVLAGTGARTGCTPTKPMYRYMGMAPEANIIAVKTSFGDLSIIDAVDYCFEKADSLNRPCVVNISLGTQYGPHDGSGDFAKAVSALTRLGRIVVASAGNERVTARHGKLKTTSTTLGVDKFTLTVPAYTAHAGDYNDYFLVNGWVDLSASVTIRVKGPGATDTCSCGLNNSVQRTRPGGTIYIANNYAPDGYGPTTTARQFEVEIYDSASTKPPAPGTWEIDVKSNSSGSFNKRADIWMYDADLGTAVTSPVVVIGLNDSTQVGSPADGDSVIAVGAYSTRSNWISCSNDGNLCQYASPPTIGAIASFSSRGPRRDGKQKPDITAPGHGILTSRSIYSPAIPACGDADDGVHVITQGTSVAAPHVAGAVAMYLESQKFAPPSQVRKALQNSARTDAFTGVVPNALWGYGKLDAYAFSSVNPPQVHVLAPNGGEVYAPNTLQTINWTAFDSTGVDSVSVQYSLNKGLQWVTLLHGVPGTGTLNWTTPNAVTTGPAGGVVRVIAWDADRNSGADTSDASFSVVGVSGAPGARPAVFWLGGASPNPTTGRTTFQFSLSRKGEADLGLYNAAGRRVATLVRGVQDAGPHDVSWSGKGMASGVYFYRLVADGRLSVRKLVIAR